MIMEREGAGGAATDARPFVHRDDAAVREGQLPLAALRSMLVHALVTATDR
jgi:hypothetical protein